MSERFDLMVIGGGPAGYLAAERASREGMRVILFERRALGGVCLNEGCIPSKALLNSAKLYEHALHSAQYGVHCGEVRLDQREVTARPRSAHAGERCESQAARGGCDRCNAGGEARRARR